MSVVAQQLASSPSIPSGANIRCNTYSFGNKAVLLGDAAHGTGGGTGQGLNAALMDTVYLVDCLLEHYRKIDNCKEDDERSSLLRQALLAYSQCAVPEGTALYDLACPPKRNGKFAALKQIGRNLRDTLFGGKFGIGKVPIHSLLTSSLQSFSEIRRDRAKYYDKAFPDSSEWNMILAHLDDTANV